MCTELLAQTTRAFARAHVRLLAGTDAPTAVVVPGFSLHAELRAIAAAGPAPYDTLRSATVDAAAFLNTRDRGTLEPGKRADAVLLDANPLDDIGNTSRVAGVLVNGRQLHATLRSRQAHLNVLFLSGYTDEFVASQFVTGPHAAFLQKPFTLESLTRTVRELLDAGPRTRSSETG